MVLPGSPDSSSTTLETEEELAAVLKEQKKAEQEQTSRQTLRSIQRAFREALLALPEEEYDWFRLRKEGASALHTETLLAAFCRLEDPRPSRCGLYRLEPSYRDSTASFLTWQFNHSQVDVWHVPEERRAWSHCQCVVDTGPLVILAGRLQSHTLPEFYTRFYAPRRARRARRKRG